MANAKTVSAIGKAQPRHNPFNADGTKSGISLARQRNLDSERRISAPTLSAQQIDVPSWLPIEDTLLCTVGSFTSFTCKTGQDNIATIEDPEAWPCQCLHLAQSYGDIVECLMGGYKSLAIACHPTTKHPGRIVRGSNGTISRHRIAKSMACMDYQPPSDTCVSSDIFAHPHAVSSSLTLSHGERWMERGIKFWPVR